MNNITDFTTGKIFPKMFKYSASLIVALILQALYGAVDLLIIGHFGDSSSTSAVASGSHIMQTMTGIVTGFTIGITVVIGRLIGSNDDNSIGKVVGNVSIIFSIFAVIITVVMMSMSSYFVKWLQVPPEAFIKCRDYLLICSAGSVFIIAYNVISGIFRGIGNSNLPLIFIAIACVVNIILDLLFVGVLKLDAIGAALATIIAQAVSVVCSVVVIYKKKNLLHLSKSSFKFDKNISKKVLKIGSPIALQDGLTNVSFLILHSFINAMGVSQSAAVGIAEKLFVILAIVPMAYLSTLATVVAQNEGANLTKRSNLALIEGIGISFVFGLATFLFTQYGANILAKVFTDDEAVIYQTVIYLKSSGWEYLIIAVSFCLFGYFNGKGKTIFVMLQGLVSTFLFRIPMSYYFSVQPDTNMYLMGIPIPLSALASLIICLIYLLIYTIKSKRYKPNI